jgi:hypothetical protein
MQANIRSTSLFLSKVELDIDAEVGIDTGERIGKESGNWLVSFTINRELMS